MTTQQWFSISQAAPLLGKSKNALWDSIKNGTIPAKFIRKNGNDPWQINRLFIFPTELDNPGNVVQFPVTTLTDLDCDRIADAVVAKLRSNLRLVV